MYSDDLDFDQDLSQILWAMELVFYSCPLNGTLICKVDRIWGLSMELFKYFFSVIHFEMTKKKE